MSTKSWPQQTLVERDPRAIDAVLGKKRVSEFTPEQLRARRLAIAEAYPDWAMYHEQVARERMQAYLASREPHPAAKPPPGRQPPREAAFPGPSATDVKRAYGSKD